LRLAVLPEYIVARAALQVGVPSQKTEYILLRVKKQWHTTIDRVKSGRENIQFQEDNICNQKVAAELDAYFEKKLREFSVSLDIRGTEFQRLVWETLLNIPYGETRSYGEIARAIGHPRASRAVGLANGANPISIIIPCHRVIGASGKLVGYGGGLHRKQALLDLESSVRY